MFKSSLKVKTQNKNLNKVEVVNWTKHIFEKKNSENLK